MATSWATETPEKINHAKLCRLLYDGGATAVRAVVDHHCPPATLAVTLKAKKTQLQKLKKPKGKVLNNDQWDKLYPPSGASPSTNDFDITLLFVLIRNICGLTAPAAGWDALPPTTDTSTEANLARIKYYRNKVIGHSEKAEIDDVQYEAFWNDISSALVSLGLNQDDVDDLKERPLGAEDYYKLLKDWYLEDMAIKDKLCDIENTIVAGFTNLEEKISQSQMSAATSDIDKLFYQEFRSRISSKCDLYHPNTREWILDQVKAHVESDSQEAMVIQAGPGMGKSVLAAKICQIYQEQGILGACHFFEHGDSSRNNPRLMLQSVAHQLCNSIPDYKVAVEKVLQSDHMRNSISVSKLSCKELLTLLFEEACSQFGYEPTRKFVIVIDALDECCNSLKKEFFQAIREKVYFLPSWLRFVMTTRPPPSISSQVRGTTIEIDPEDSQNTEDLQRFFIDKLKELPHISLDQQQQSNIEQLVDLTEGFFLVASFVIDFLKKPGVNSLKEALEHFPKGISSVYEDYFSRLRDEITPYLKSEEGFYNMLDAVVKAKSPIEKNIFYDILDFREESRIPDSKRKEAINLLHQLFPVENDHVSPFHKTVNDWLTSGDHDFVAKGNGNEVLASACYDVLKKIKQEILQKQNQPTQLTDKEIYAFEFGLDYMKESESFSEEQIQRIAVDPYLLCNEAIIVARRKSEASVPSQEGYQENLFRQQLSSDTKAIFDQIETFRKFSSTNCIVPEITVLQCFHFTLRAYNLLQIQTEERTIDYLKENQLPYHERETILELKDPVEDAQIFPCNGGFFLVAKCNQKTLARKYQLDGTLVGEIQFSLNTVIRMSPDSQFIVVHDFEYHSGDDIAFVDAANMEKVTSYRLPNVPKSFHVFGDQPWYIVARCFNNKIYIVEGKTGKLVNTTEVQQNDDVLCVSNVGHILLSRKSAAHRFSTNIVQRLFTDEDRLFCFPMQGADDDALISLLGETMRKFQHHVVSRELFICNHNEINKKIPIYFRLLKCRYHPSYVINGTDDDPSVLFSEDGNLLAFYNASSITVVNTSDGSLYTSVCLYHNRLGNCTKILYLSEERIVIKGNKSIFSCRFTGESRPCDVDIEHVYYLPGNVRVCSVVLRSSNNMKELWGKRVKTKLVSHGNDVKEQEDAFGIEKYIFHDL